MPLIAFETLAVTDVYSLTKSSMTMLAVPFAPSTEVPFTVTSLTLPISSAVFPPTDATVIIPPLIVTSPPLFTPPSVEPASLRLIVVVPEVPPEPVNEIPVPSLCPCAVFVSSSGIPSPVMSAFVTAVVLLVFE